MDVTMNNGMNGGYNYGYGYPNNGYYMPNAYGYQPITPTNFQVPQNNNALTDEEIKQLMNDRPSNAIDLNVKPTDVLRAICTHKSGGQDRVQQVNDNSGDVWCPICNARWSQVPLTEEQVTELVNALVGTMQNAKWVGDLPIEMTRELFPLIPLLEKYPEVYRYAMKNFDKYYNTRVYNSAQDASVYSNYNSLLTPQYVNPYAYQQMYTQPQQQATQGYYYQQPQQGATPVNNPYNNPMQTPYGGIDPNATNQQFNQQAMNMMVNPYGQPVYAQQPMAQAQPQMNFATPPQAAPATNAAPQAYTPGTVETAPAATAEGATETASATIQL